jgi:prepilin-type N-terminal cleavage/methylation domain-containing protein
MRFMNMRFGKKHGFTLVELLVVMAVIIILASLVLSLIPYVNKKIARTTTTGQLKALASALEAYKADNGIYPNDALMSGGAGTYSRGCTDTLNAQTNGDPTKSVYINAGLVLYRALSGDRNLDRSVNSSDQTIDLTGTNTLTPPLTTVPTQYYTVDPSMLLPSGGTGTVTAFIDAFGYSFGYSTICQGDVAVSGSTSPGDGYNPTYDLWSTAGVVSSAANTTTIQLQWIGNWASTNSQ